MDDLNEEMNELEGISLPDSGDEDEFDLGNLVLPDLESVEYEAPDRPKIVLPDAVNEATNHILDDYVPPREVDDYNYRNVKYGDYDSGRGVRSHEHMHPDTYSGVLDKLPEDKLPGDLVFDETGGFSTEDTSLKEFPGFYTEDENEDSEDNLDDIMASFDEDDDLMSEFTDTVDDSDLDDSDDIPGFDDIMDDGFGGDDIFGGEEELDEDTLKIKNFDLDEVIDVAIKRKASDLHLVGDDYVLLTIHDEIQRIDDFGVLPFDLVDHLMLEILTNVLETEFVDELELDTSYVVRTGPSKGRRSRLNVAKSLNKVTMTFRIVSDVIPPPDALGIPQVMQDWIKLPSGLIMVNGPTGTGKALYIDELVPTVDGMKRVGDVVLGDTLFDETGVETQVIGVHPSEDIESFNLLFENGERVRAAGNHLWKVKYLGGEVESSGKVFMSLLKGEDFTEAKVRLSQLSDLDEVIALKDVFPLFPRSSPVELNDVVLRECTEVSERVFRVSDVLTVLLEESVRREDRVELSAEGASFVLTTRELADVMRYDSEWGVELLTDPVEFSSVNLPMDSYSAGVFSVSELSGGVGVDQRILSAGEEVLEEVGSLEALLDLYIYSPSEDRLGFLAGVLDLLGSVSEDGVSVESSSSILLRGLRSLISSMGWLVKSEGSALSFIPDRQVFKNLSEEREVLGEVLESASIPEVVKILSVQRSGVVRSGEFICFEVDSDSSLFLTSESFIPTHNTTTLASLLNEVNLYENKKIVTVENPIEFLYGNQGKGLVVQREVGKDTRSFTKALNSAMRQNPNLILIGEVRDRVEIDALVRSAESGHLAVSTMHTVSAPMTISRIMSLYVGDEQSRIMGTLADVSRGFANQTLLKRKDGKGMVAVREVLPITPEVSDLIRNGDVAGIRSYQMDHEITMDHELIAEVKRGTVTLETARLESTYPDFFDELAKENSLNL